MNKKEKGFTLIELLAIIVILAIIAVITVPIILNIIEESKKGAAKDSAYGYKDSVNKYYTQELLNNQNSKIATLNGWYLSSCKTNSIDFYGEAEGATSYANPTTISLINAPNAINQLYIFIHPNNANTSTTSNGITNINKTSGWTYGGSAWDSFSLGQIAGYVYNESTLVNANQAVSNPDLSLLSALSKSNLSVTSISIQESSSSTDKTK